MYRYINGLLIPEIHVVRGKTYTFVVEGGDNPEFATGNTYITYALVVERGDNPEYATGNT